jgi:hypothetical protein
LRSSSHCRWIVLEANFDMVVGVNVDRTPQDDGAVGRDAWVRLIVGMTPPDSAGDGSCGWRELMETSAA